MAAGFDFQDLADFKDQLSQVATVYPLEVEQALSSAGNKARKMLKEQSPKTSSDHKNKLSKSWHGRINADAITAHSTRYDIWTTAPHFHLVNNGHMQTAHNGRPIRYIAGKHFFETVMQDVADNVIPDKLDRLYQKITNMMD